MTKTLKQHTAHAIAWSFVDKFGQQALLFVVGLILARNYISVDDYGLIAMISIFIALSNVLLDSGFGGALIRKKNATQTDLCSVFYFNIAISICLYLMLFFCAPLIATFYEQPILVSLCRVSGLTFLINAVALIQFILLSKKAKFKHIAIANGIGVVCGTVSALFMAAKGFGVWTLVWQNIIFYTTRSIFLWAFSTWHPSLIFDIKSIKGLWGFSSKVMLTGLLNNIFGNIYPLLIGKVYLPQDVGYYSQGNKFSDLPANTIYATLQTATYPILSQIGDDNERLKRAYRKVIRVTSFISFPILFGMAAIAAPLVHVLLTDKWIEVVPYIEKLCIGGAFLPLVGVNTNALYVKGLSSKVLQLEIFRKLLILLCVLFTIQLSVSAMVTGLVLAHIAGFLISAMMSGKQISYKLMEQIKDIFPYFFIATIMACSVYLLSLQFTSSLLLLAMLVLIGGGLYVGAVYLLGSKIFREMLELVKSKQR